MVEQIRTGIGAIEAITALLQRSRSLHPTHGSFEAAELQFWWTQPRPTDTFEQLFWFDDEGRPDAAFCMNDFGDGSSLTYGAPTALVAFLPDPDPAMVEAVVDRGLAHLAEHGVDGVELEIGRDDPVMRTVLTDRGFTVTGEGLHEAWLDASAVPPVSALADGYRLCSRAEVNDRPHHFVRPDRPDVEDRLNQVSLYSPDLDLFVLAPDDTVAGYGLCWNDPVTGVGVIEPMRTADDHQQKGIARHILTAGVDRLATAGAERMKIAFAADNPGASHLYPDVGFVSHRVTDIFGRARPTGS